MRTFFIFIFVSVVSLYVYNPELDDFKDHIAEINFELNQDIQQNNPLGRTITRTNQDPIPTIVGSSIKEKNFLMFSIYELDIGTSVTRPVVWRYVGILGMFFEIDSPVLPPPPGNLPTN